MKKLSPCLATTERVRETTMWATTTIAIANKNVNPASLAAVRRDPSTWLIAFTCSLPSGTDSDAAIAK
jgi:hypothetical protein